MNRTKKVLATLVLAVALCVPAVPAQAVVQQPPQKTSPCARKLLLPCHKRVVFKVCWHTSKSKIHCRTFVVRYRAR